MCCWPRATDLLNWEVRPPVTRPAGFGHLEVPQVAVVDGQPLLLFCSNLSARSEGGPIWVVPGPSVTGPWDMSLAREVPCGHLYAPRLVRDTGGAWQLIGFVDERDGEFVGELSDPIPVRYTAPRASSRSADRFQDVCGSDLNAAPLCVLSGQFSAGTHGHGSVEISVR